jgi:hypothetical protein
MNLCLIVMDMSQNNASALQRWNHNICPEPNVRRAPPGTNYYSEGVFAAETTPSHNPGCRCLCHPIRWWKSIPVVPRMATLFGRFQYDLNTWLRRCG